MNWNTFTNLCKTDAIVINTGGYLTFYDKWNGVFAIGEVHAEFDETKYIDLHIQEGTTTAQIVTKALRKLIARNDSEAFKAYTIVPHYHKGMEWREWLNANQPQLQIR